MDDTRKNAIVNIAAGAAGLTTLAVTIRWGLNNRHPWLGILGGIFLSGPAAGAIAGNVARLIVGPTAPVPMIAGSTPAVSRGTPQVIRDAMVSQGQSMAQVGSYR
jgi:hypothetical protein